MQVVGGLGLGWQGAFGIVVALYFYSHYFFASGAAHIGAMYTAFLAVATACGTPPMLAAVALGQLSNLMGCLTTYGIGSAPPYFGAGYVPQVRERGRNGEGGMGEGKGLSWDGGGRRGRASGLHGAVRRLKAMVHTV